MEDLCMGSKSARGNERIRTISKGLNKHTRITEGAGFVCWTASRMLTWKQPFIAKSCVADSLVWRWAWITMSRQYVPSLMDLFYLGGSGEETFTGRVAGVTVWCMLDLWLAGTRILIMPRTSGNHTCTERDFRFHNFILISCNKVDGFETEQASRWTTVNIPCWIIVLGWQVMKRHADTARIVQLKVLPLKLQRQICRNAGME
jgi:hypothetical protein